MAGAEAGAGTACARAALAGNPSDGYGGAVLAVTVGDYCARAVARHASRLTVQPQSALVEATVRRFTRELAPEAQPSSIRWTSTIPHTVGLGGSSAIVIATLRALSECYGVHLPRSALAAFALAVEVQDLGIAAGLQDRVAQAYGGLTFMDFEPQRTLHGHGSYEQLDPGQLPPLLIASRCDAAQHSGDVHRGLRARFARGDGIVRSAMSELAALARGARAALLAGDRDEFARCVDATFDARQRIIALDPRHVEMIECARASGASANYTGSGGAIVAACRDEAHRREVLERLTAVGCKTVLPTPAR